MRESSSSNPENWIEYWDQDEFWTGTSIWERNNEAFIRGAKDVICLSQDTRILNIGCGEGHLENLLASKVRSIHSLDTSQRFVDLCRERCRGYSNVSVELLGEDYTDLSFLSDTYTLILCVSVVQYYRSIDEIIALIGSGATVSAPGGNMLVADLPRKRGKVGEVWDILCSLSMSARYGYAREYLRTAWSRLFQPTVYREFSSSAPELAFTRSDIAHIVDALPRDVEIINENMSICANRPSLWVQF